MARQWDAVAALRARAALAAGWNTTWPVAFANQPFDTPDERQWIEESIDGGPGVPVAITAPNLITYRFSGSWTLTLITPVDSGARSILDMGDLLQSTLLAMPAPTLPGNIPLLIDGVDVGQPFPTEGDMRRQVVVRYAFYANATPGTVVVDPDHAILTTGLTQQLTAHAYDADGDEISPATFAWATSNPAIATVDGTGLVTAIGNGSCIITATRNGLVGACNVAVASLFFGP